MTPEQLIKLPHVQAALDFQYEELGITIAMQDKWARENMFGARSRNDSLELLIGSIVLLRIFWDGRIEMPKVRKDWLHFEMEEL